MIQLTLDILGKTSKYKDDKYIYSVPDYNLLDRVEDLKSIYGKN